jgi:hypothetical protein
MATTASIPVEIALDRCLMAIRQGSYSIDECLAQYPVYKEELEPLLILVLRLQSGRTMEAPSEFRNDAISRINNLIASHPRPSKHHARARLASLEKAPGFSTRASKGRFSFKLLMIVIFLLIVLFVAGAGVVSAASRALPGSIFYPIKDSVEMIQLATTSDALDKSALYLNYSQQRLDEADVLLQSEQLGEAKYSLIDYQVEANTTLASLGEVSSLTIDQRVNLAQQTIEIYSKNKMHLEALLSQTPDIIRPSVDGALYVTNQVLDRARQLIGETP